MATANERRRAPEHEASRRIRASSGCRACETRPIVRVRDLREALRSTGLGHERPARQILQAGIRIQRGSPERFRVRQRYTGALPRCPETPSVRETGLARSFPRRRGATFGARIQAPSVGRDDRSRAHAILASTRSSTVETRMTSKLHDLGRTLAFGLLAVPIVGVLLGGVYSWPAAKLTN